MPTIILKPFRSFEKGDSLFICGETLIFEKKCNISRDKGIIENFVENLPFECNLSIKGSYFRGYEIEISPVWDFGYGKERSEYKPKLKYKTYA